MRQVFAIALVMICLAVAQALIAQEVASWQEELFGRVNSALSELPH